jgi:hypothetical protein
VRVDRLIHWLRNDRFHEERDTYSRIWNAASKHVEESVIPRLLAEASCDGDDQ